MSTKVEYVSRLNKIVTKQQSLQGGCFNEKYYVDDRLKQNRNFWDNEIQVVYFYVYPDENLTDELNTLGKNVVYSIAKEMETINGYEVWKYYDYKNGSLDDKMSSIKVFDSQNRMIAIKLFVDGILKKGRKIYYLAGKHVVNLEEELDFIYKEDDMITFKFGTDGVKISVSFNPADGYFTNAGLFHGTYEDRLPFMTDDILNYFTNADQLVPTLFI